MHKSAKSAFLFIGLLLAAAAAFYIFSPDGFFGYDEGTRLAAFTARSAGELLESNDSSATVFYTPKYGADQSISVEFTKGPDCSGSDCFSSTVVVHVEKGKSGAGYALGRNVSVARYFSVHKSHGPIRLDLSKHSGVVQLVGLE